MRVVVTGSNGFIGKRFIEYNAGKYTLVPLSLRSFKATEIDLVNTDAIVHLAGQAHAMGPIDDRIYFEINFELTRKLADEAKKQGVSTFIYISSVKVYGDREDLFVNEDSTCEPTDAYGKSKLEAENYLRSIQDQHFNVAIIRPPMVYGPGVKGNMVRLLKLAESNLVLPLGGTANKRSMVYLDNLVELINRVIETRATGVFVAGDERPLSTSELLSLIRGFMGKKSGMLTIPQVGKKLLRIMRPALYSRLFGSFIIDHRKTDLALSFTPPFSTEYGVKQMVEWYLSHKGDRKLTPAFK